MQMKTINKWMGSLLLVVASCLVIASCKRTFDPPPITGTPEVVANLSIKDLKARYTLVNNVVPITDDVIIRGIVNMDDKSGNYYQQISIQDTTGGILLRLAGSNLNTNYPVGREIFVKLKGMYLGDYGRVIQVGGGSDPVNGGVTLLSANLQDQHIIKGALNQPLIPKVVTINQLGTNLQDPYVSVLVQINNAQFLARDTAKGFSDATASGNRTVRACGSATDTMIVRTSNYSNFGTIHVPTGNGTLTGIYAQYNGTKQFSVRDTNDTRFHGPRCPGSGGGGGGGPAGGPVITLGTTSPYIITFDNIASGLPNGVKIGMGNNATTVDSSGTAPTAKSSWNVTTAGFKNFASADVLPQGSAIGDQDTATNRALGIRQTGTASIGGDPGAGVTFLIDNTLGKTNLAMNFHLMSLDPASARTTTWIVEYGTGNTPTFAAVTPTGSNMTGNSTFTNNTLSVSFGSALDNVSGKVWIRIYAKNSTTGGGSRASTGIDDVKFTWN